MSYDLKIERRVDAPPELVFDTIVDPSAGRGDLRRGRRGMVAQEVRE
jgi:hypothetical protein